MRFEENPNFAREIERELEFRNGKVRIGEQVVQTAKQLSPVRTGAYRDSLQVKALGPQVWVTATDFKGHWIEWGSINNPAFAPIRKAVIASGLRLREVPKALRQGRRNVEFVIEDV